MIHYYIVWLPFSSDEQMAKPTQLVGFALFIWKKEVFRSHGGSADSVGDLIVSDKLFHIYSIAIIVTYLPPDDTYHAYVSYAFK